MLFLAALFAHQRPMQFLIEALNRVRLIEHGQLPLGVRIVTPWRLRDRLASATDDEFAPDRPEATHPSLHSPVQRNDHSSSCADAGSANASTTRVHARARLARL